MFFSIGPGTNAIKLFVVVIYCHFKITPPFCVVELYYLGNYHGIAVNYYGISVTNVVKHTVT
jgi:hypothetical protein